MRGVFDDPHGHSHLGVCVSSTPGLRDTTKKGLAARTGGSADLLTSLDFGIRSRENHDEKGMAMKQNLRRSNCCCGPFSLTGYISCALPPKASGS